MRRSTAAAAGEDVPTIAAGGLVVRPALTGHEVMLVHRGRYDDWSFPKGKLDPGESPADAALREVHEETGLRCALSTYLGTVVYHDEVVRPKTTHYWVMTMLIEDPFTPNDEIVDRRWFSLHDASSTLSRPIDRQLLRSL